jgi:hypothetical protein
MREQLFIRAGLGHPPEGVAAENWRGERIEEVFPTNRGQIR